MRRTPGTKPAATAQVKAPEKPPERDWYAPPAKPYSVKMLATRYGHEAGIQKQSYLAGETYRVPDDMPDPFAQQFIAAGAAERADE